MNWKNTILSSLLTILLFGGTYSLKGQEIERDQKTKSRVFESSQSVWITPNYAFQIPFGDMKQRFGPNSLFSFNVTYKTKNNWIIGGEGGFLFGTKVKQGYVLNNLVTSTGQFVTQTNELTNVRPTEQGFNIKFEAGKMVPLNPRTPDAGLLFITGAGFLEHKIAMNTLGSDLPQLDKTYRKGYDRMSNGPVFSQFVGYAHTKRKAFVNFYAGAEFDIAYTEGRRPYDFYLMEPLHDKRLDMFLGFKIGWVIPIFMQSSDKEVFYY